MREYEIMFNSRNSANYAKPISAFLIEPERLDAQTGLMHFAHGWGGNRYQYREMQREFSDRYNLVCVATEYRQSGYDFDAVTGKGAYLPYDASHFQVIDCLNAVRHVLRLYPGINRERVIDFGGSQGGHVAMLMSIFSPCTFALVIGACGISHLDEKWVQASGREFGADELAIRNVVRMADRVQCQVVLMHGTADETVPDRHTRMLEQALLDAGKTVTSKYYEGGDHALGPVTNRRDSVVEMADGLIDSARNTNVDDFTAGREVRIPCETKSFVIDWSKAPDDVALTRWEQK
ncbi:MAG: DUF2920 family protein [bacterium]|nr:DUF2920 family protein [bacterium]